MFIQTTRIIAGLSEIIENYYGFLVDAWGVLHDGRNCYPGAIKCLEHLAALGRPVVILSNAARRHQAIEQELSRVGIKRALYAEVVSSGELAWNALRYRNNRWYAELGRHGYYFGPERSRGITGGLDIEWVEQIEQADFVLNTGALSGNPVKAEIFDPQLRTMIRRELPMICANPDRIAIRGGSAGISAGAIAKRYEELGGTDIFYHGKPDVRIYSAALDSFGHQPQDKVLAIGDAFETDIQGAFNASLDALLIAGGIHSRLLQPLDSESLNRCARYYGLSPKLACEYFRW